jgi:hypothetical protein
MYWYFTTVYTKESYSPNVQMSLTHFSILSVNGWQYSSIMVDDVLSAVVEHHGKTSVVSTHSTKVSANAKG